MQDPKLIISQAPSHPQGPKCGKENTIPHVTKKLALSKKHDIVIWMISEMILRADGKAYIITYICIYIYGSVPLIGVSAQAGMAQYPDEPRPGRAAARLGGAAAEPGAI